MKKNVARLDKVFPVLDGVQLLELSCKMTGELGGEVQSEIQVNSSAKFQRERESGAIRLHVLLQLNCIGTRQNNPVFEASARIVGMWMARSEIDAEKEELDRQLIDAKTPFLYPLIRQHLADLLARMGIHADSWPWNPWPLGSTSSAQAALDERPRQEATPKKPAKKK
jgi:hypothetical protein